MKENVEKKVEKKQEYELIIEAKRIQGKKENGEEYDFLTFEGYEKSGRKCRFIFTKDCNEQIEEVGTYKVIVDKKNINKDKQNRFSRYFIKAVKSIEVFNNSYDNDDDLDF